MINLVMMVNDCLGVSVGGCHATQSQMMQQPALGAPMMMPQQQQPQQARPASQPVVQQVAPQMPGIAAVAPQQAPVATPQQKHGGAYPRQGITKFEDFDDSGEDTDGDDEGGSKKKRPRTNRKMTEEQKVERR